MFGPSSFRTLSRKYFKCFCRQFHVEPKYFSFLGLVNQKAWLLTLFWISIFVIGCEKPMPDPERIDPIYDDLEKDLKKVNGAVDELEAAVVTAKKDMDEAGPRNIMRKRLTREFYEKRKLLEKVRQKAEYQQLLLVKRLHFVRTQYLKAYNAKEKWPNPLEFEEYMANKRLRLASRSWAGRVPRLHKPAEELKAQAEAAKKAEKAAASESADPAEGGGGH